MDINVEGIRDRGHSTTTCDLPPTPSSRPTVPTTSRHNTPVDAYLALTARQTA